jgi:hypothetical protein
MCVSRPKRGAFTILGILVIVYFESPGGLDLFALLELAMQLLKWF